MALQLDKVLTITEADKLNKKELNGNERKPIVLIDWSNNALQTRGMQRNKPQEKEKQRSNGLKKKDSV